MEVVKVGLFTAGRAVRYRYSYRRSSKLLIVILQAGAAEVDCSAVARQRGTGLAAGGRQQGLLVVLQGGAVVVGKLRVEQQ